MFDIVGLLSDNTENILFCKIAQIVYLYYIGKIGQTHIKAPSSIEILARPLIEIYPRRKRYKYTSRPIHDHGEFVFRISVISYAKVTFPKEILAVGTVLLSVLCSNYIFPLVSGENMVPKSADKMEKARQHQQRGGSGTQAGHRSGDGDYARGG